MSPMIFNTVSIMAVLISCFIKWCIEKEIEKSEIRIEDLTEEGYGAKKKEKLWVILEFVKYEMYYCFNYLYTGVIGMSIGLVLLAQKRNLLAGKSIIVNEWRSINGIALLGTFSVLIFMIKVINGFEMRRRRVVEISEEARQAPMVWPEGRYPKYLKSWTIITYERIEWEAAIPWIYDIPFIGKMYLRRFIEPSDEYLTYLFQKELYVGKTVLILRRVTLVLMWVMVCIYTTSMIRIVSLNSL